MAGKEEVESPVSRDVLLEARLDPGVHAEKVEIRRIAIKAGHAVGAHVHNGPVVGSIVEGSVLFQVEDQPRRTLRPGDVFYEPAEVRIAHFDALEEDVVFLAYFPLAAGQQAELTPLTEKE